MNLFRFAIGGVALLCAQFAQAQTMFRGDSAHTGANSGQAPRQFHRVKWKFPTGDRVVSSPVLHDKTLYFGGDDGNIYAVEALFLAGVNPLKAAHRLSKPRARKLYQAIREVLREAIDAGSTLRIDLADGNGSYFETPERFWRVYEREGEPCVRCGTKIKRVVHGGRSTYYCPQCQKR